MSIAFYTLKSIAYILSDPITLFGLLVFIYLFYKQNKKTAIMQKMIIGEQLNSPLELTLSQVTLGIFAGVIGSLILSYLGVMFDDFSAVSLIFAVSVIFLFINPKYMCFSYSGAIVGIISVVLSEIAYLNRGVIVNISGSSLNLSDLDVLKVNIAALMTMVGVLHVMEGILVMFDGKTGSIPIFTSKDDKIVGGFALKRYWLLPVAMMIIIHDSSSLGSTVNVATPGWWPIMKPSMAMEEFKKIAISMLPLLGGLGYNSITFTKDKKSKTLISGSMILVYGLVLALISQIANINIFTKVMVLLFAPLAHEFILRFGKYTETKGKPKFVSDENGIMVLDVAPNTPAFEMNIRSGDKLVELNNVKITNEEQILNITSSGSNFIWFKIQRPDGKIEEVSYNKMNASKHLGIVFVPLGVPKDSLVVKFDDGKFSDILNKIKNKK